MNRERYIELLSDLLNRERSPDKERRVREANRELYGEVVNKRASLAQADLALVQAAQREQT